MHRVDLEPNNDTMTIFIPENFVMIKKKRAKYKTKI